MKTDDNYTFKSLSLAIRQAQKIVETKALQEIGATLNRVDFDGICGDEIFDSDLYWECILRHFASTIHHPVSTSRMGNVSDETAVVDPLLRYSEQICDRLTNNKFLSGIAKTFSIYFLSMPSV